MKRRAAFGYCRQSSHLENGSFDRQEQSIRGYCKSNGYKLIKIFREQVSGAKSEDERPIFTEMIREILADHVDTIVVEGLDRLARQLMIQELLLVYLASKDIHLISAATGENVTEAISADPMKKALIQLQGVISELERGMIVKRLQAGRKRSTKKMGRKNFGFHPGEEQTLVKMCELRDEGLSFRKIAEALNGDPQRKTRNGQPWTLFTVRAIMQGQKPNAKRRKGV